MSTLDVTNLKSKLALTPTKFYDKDDKEIGTLCRAWVNFNGTGTVAIRASFNVSSITDNNTGDYSVNFTNAMPDANYSFSSSQGRLPQAVGLKEADVGVRTINSINLWSVGLSAGLELYDVEQANVAFFR